MSLYLFFIIFLIHVFGQTSLSAGGGRYHQRQLRPDPLFMLRRLAFLSGAGPAGPRTGQSPLFHLLGGRRQAACRYH